MPAYNNRGRPKGTTKQNLLLLDYRTWTIEYNESAWPSVNYILRKKETKKAAYCGTLESALRMLYSEILVDYAKCKNDYDAKFCDLAEAIDETKNELSDLLDFSPTLKNKIKMMKNENNGC